MKVKNCVIITCCVLLAAFLLGVSGVLRLTTAVAPETPGAAEGDRLVGVFVTRDYLDLSDGQDNRLYAALTDVTHTGEDAGETVKTKEYRFDAEGIRFFTARISDASGGYWSTQTDEGITDGAVHFNTGDAGDSISLKGTIFLTAPASGTFYLNPVYQTSDGQVYAVSGEGVYLGGESTPGSSWNQKLTQTLEMTAPDAEASSNTEVEVTISVMDRPGDIAILEFNGGHELLKKTDYRPGEIPDRVAVTPETAYILLETETADGIRREIFQKGDDMGYAFYSRDDGICLKQEWEIGWDS